MLIKRPDDIKPSEITSRTQYLNRRALLVRAGAMAAAGGAGGLFLPESARAIAMAEKASGPVLQNVSESPLSTTDEALTPYEDVTSYNNFYEFGTGKSDPARESRDFQPRPWSVQVDGECERPGTYDLEDFLKPNKLEERIYRFRCVEAWSMVVPWIGIPLKPVLDAFKPTSKARYVAFQTLHDPERMPGQRYGVLDWPYVEGLRIDEAMHPLTILVVGLYGHELPNQNGAPLRLMVPWKYGFKSIKSIVRVSFTEQQPPTSWNKSAPYEYGFYSNVNPQVSHPRWSQKRERRIGDFFKRETLMFNGYSDQVASLYAGMDLKKNF